MLRTVLLATFWFTAAWCSPAIAEDDPIKARLDEAKATFESAMEPFREKVGKWLDDEEQAARERGAKLIVDRIKEARREFQQNDQLPKEATAELKREYAALRASMEAAFKFAVKEYTKASKDDEADAIQDELTDFRAGGPVIQDMVRPQNEGMFHYSLRNILRHPVALEFRPTGERANLGSGQSVDCRSPVRDGQHPSVVAIAPNGKKGEREIENRNGYYRIIDYKGDGSLVIAPAHKVEKGEAGTIQFSIRNDSRHSVGLYLIPSGERARLEPGQSIDCRSPIQDGLYPSVMAIAPNGNAWRRIIKEQEGNYTIVDYQDKYLRINSR